MTVGNVGSAALPPLPPPTTGAGAPKVASAPVTVKPPVAASAPTAGADSDGDHDGSGGKVNVLA